MCVRYLVKNPLGFLLKNQRFFFDGLDYVLDDCSSSVQLTRKVKVERETSYFSQVFFFFTIFLLFDEQEQRRPLCRYVY